MIPHLVRVEGERAGGANSLAHEPVVVADLVEHLVLVHVVDLYGMLRGGTGQEGREGGRGRE